MQKQRKKGLAHLPHCLLYTSKEQEKRREKQNVKNGYDYQWGLSGGAKSLPDESIHCCVTSPPYYALRDYGKENQIGREGAPEEYIGHLVSVFCELKRVLRSDGTFWLNIADCYSRKSYHGLSGCKPKELMGLPWLLALTLRKEGWFLRSDIIWQKDNPMPESAKDRPSRCYEHIFCLLYTSGVYRYLNVAALPCSLILTPPDDEQSPGIFHLQEDFE